MSWDSLVCINQMSWKNTLKISLLDGSSPHTHIVVKGLWQHTQWDLPFFVTTAIHTLTNNSQTLTPYRFEPTYLWQTVALSNSAI
jgi:hypothetical protein